MNIKELIKYLKEFPDYSEVLLPHFEQIEHFYLIPTENDNEPVLLISHNKNTRYRNTLKEVNVYEREKK